MAFLRNVWYVAAWASELETGKPLARRLLDEPIVFFRDAAGAPHALFDRCPHRFAPLSMGQVEGNVIRCLYHGLEFDATGQCVHNPHGGTIPKAACTRAYPVVERHSLIWIWMGEAERADPATIPDFTCLNADTWYVGEGYLHVNSDYRLENDNILDLSHIQYMHPASLGSKVLGDGRTEVTQEGNQIWSKRTVLGEVLSDFIYHGIGIPVGTPVDRWTDVRWDPPSTMWLSQLVLPAGQPKPSREGFGMTVHIFTPETEKTTHYWYGFSWEKAYFPAHLPPGQGYVNEAVKWLTNPFMHEDLPMLEAVQKTMGSDEFWKLKPVLLAPDVAAVRVRRTLDKLIADEQAEYAAKAQNDAQKDSMPISAEVV